MKRRHWLWAPVLVLGGVVSATGGAAVIDMPAAPRVYRSGVEVSEPSETAPAETLGEVALERFARQRSTPAYASMASPAWWGWPYGRYGVGYGAWPRWGWGWPHGWGRGWAAWGFPYSGFSPCWGGWGFRSPFIGRTRIRYPVRGIHWRGAGLGSRRGWR